MKFFSQQPWLNSAKSDAVFILSPPFFSLLLVFLFPEQFRSTSVMPAVYWIILVVFIDVAHVYSTLYRTYFNTAGMKSSTVLLVLIPLGCYVGGVLLYHIDGLVFWRALAYLAVFHFIRQQYGFMRLYSRFEQSGRLMNLIDGTTVYTASFFPILYWHFGEMRNFSWFVSGDFFYFRSETLVSLFSYGYVLVLTLYLTKEVLLVVKTGTFNVPRNLVIAGTFLSWYFGIVYFNGDMAFTTLNVISHGIPYMALIWFFEKKKYKKSPSRMLILRLTFSKYGFWLFLALILLLAYFEEGLWDGLIWQEHGDLFTAFKVLPLVSDQDFLTLLVPLLALPQSTHYVLDGFIWRRAQDS